VPDVVGAMKLTSIGRPALSSELIYNPGKTPMSASTVSGDRGDSGYQMTLFNGRVMLFNKMLFRNRAHFMDKTEYDEIVGLQYIRDGTYQDGAIKNYKRRLREKAKSFAVEEDCLIHRGLKGKMQKVVKKDEKGVIHQLHAGVVGDCHFSINATQKKVIQIFFVFCCYSDKPSKSPRPPPRMATRKTKRKLNVDMTRRPLILYNDH